MCTRVRHVHLAFEPQWLTCVRFYACPTRLFMHGKFSVTDNFAGLLELPILPWACMWTLSMPGQLSSPLSFCLLGISGSPACNTVPLAGRSGLADTFLGCLKLSPLPQTCMRTLSVLGQLMNPSVPNADDQLHPPPPASMSSSCNSVPIMSPTFLPTPSYPCLYLQTFFFFPFYYSASGHNGPISHSTMHT